MIGINNSHHYSILNLLINYDADLNVINQHRNTVLDVVVFYGEKLDEEIKNCIMTLVNFGARTNYPEKNMIYNFIEYYKDSIIKPAIKNENKI